MKLLHTSDWHVGKMLRGRSRADEHRAVLAEIASIGKDEGVDAVLICGDLFDVSSPTAESEDIVWQALVALAELEVPVIVLSGNHDHPRRLAAVTPLLTRAKVTMVSRPRRPDDGGIVRVTSERTGETAEIGVLPFVSPRSAVSIDELMADRQEDHEATYRSRVEALISVLAGAFTPGAAHLFAGHLMIDRGVLGGGERAAQTIFDYCLPSSVFPSSAQYVALGHLHRAQDMSSSPPVRYCGSPLMLDFGETSDAKSVSIVTVRPGLPAKIDAVALRAGRRLRTVKGSLASLERLVGSIQPGSEYLRITVEEPVRPGLADDVRALFPDAVDVVLGSEHPDTMMPLVESTRDKEPRDLFADYLSDRGIEDPCLIGLFDDLLADELEHAP